MKKTFLFLLGYQFCAFSGSSASIFPLKFGEESREYSLVTNIWLVVQKSCKREKQDQQNKILRVQEHNAQ